MCLNFGVQVNSLPGAGTLYVDADANGTIDAGEAVSAGNDIAEADITAGNFKFKPAANESGTPYTTFTFKVFDGAAYSDPANTLTIIPEPASWVLLTSALSALALLRRYKATTGGRAQR